VRWIGSTNSATLSRHAITPIHRCRHTLHNLPSPAAAPRTTWLPNLRANLTSRPRPLPPSDYSRCGGAIIAPRGPSAGGAAVAGAPQLHAGPPFSFQEGGRTFFLHMHAWSGCMHDRLESDAVTRCTRARRGCRRGGGGGAPRPPRGGARRPRRRRARAPRTYMHAFWYS
jgi:hypothetical protein